MELTRGRLSIRALSLGLLLGLAPFVALASKGTPEKIVIGFNPGGDPARIKTKAAELAADLQKQIGLPIHVLISKDYDGLVEAMKDKKVDFAFLTAKTFVTAEEKAGAKVLLKKVWSEPFYFATLITRKSSKITKLKDLKGKRVTFVDRSSASGYLYPSVALAREGLKESDYADVVFSGNHAASVQTLEKGATDAIATFADSKKAESGAWTKFGALKGKDVRVLWVSEPIPNDPFCVRQEFYNEWPLVTHSLMLALVDVFDSKRGDYAELLGAKELMPATSRQYDPVREMVKSLERVSAK